MTSKKKKKKKKRVRILKDFFQCECGNPTWRIIRYPPPAQDRRKTNSLIGEAVCRACWEYEQLMSEPACHHYGEAVERIESLPTPPVIIIDCACGQVAFNLSREAALPTFREVSEELEEMGWAIMEYRNDIACPDCQRAEKGEAA